jgi:hypothetical protein
MAAELDPSMPRAFLRRARACIGLKRYGSARAAVLAGAALAPGDPRFAELAREIDEMMVVPGQRRAFPPVGAMSQHSLRPLGRSQDNQEARSALPKPIRQGQTGPKWKGPQAARSQMLQKPHTQLVLLATREQHKQ